MKSFQQKVQHDRTLHFGGSGDDAFGGGDGTGSGQGAKRGSGLCKPMKAVLDHWWRG